MHSRRLLRHLAPAALLLVTAAPLAAQADTTRAVYKFTSDFGYVATSGNTEVTTLSVGETWSRSKGRLSIEQVFGFVRGAQDGVENVNNLRAGLRADYKIDRWFAFFIGGAFDRNTFAGIERRFEEQLGLQWRALAAPSDTLRFEGGASITQQFSVDGQQLNFPAARLAARWRHLFSPASYFQQSVEVIPNLRDQDDYRINTESSVIAPISQRIGIKLSYVIRFDNVPEPTFRTTDRLFTTGIQLSY